MFWPDPSPPRTPSLRDCRTVRRFAWLPTRVDSRLGPSTHGNRPGTLWLDYYYSFEECTRTTPTPEWQVVERFI